MSAASQNNEASQRPDQPQATYSDTIQWLKLPKGAYSDVIPTVNLPEGSHDEVMINSDLHQMIANWTDLVTAADQTILTHYGQNAGRSVADTVPTLCYARIALSAFGLCSIAVASGAYFSPAEFGKRCEAIAREQIERYRAMRE